MKRLTSVFPLILLIAAVSLLPACGASEATIPTGPPVIKSFTVEDETIEPGESPWFEFEVENARAITIRQGGEVVFEIEATFPPGTEGAFREPLGNVAYALPAGGSEPSHPYPAGIYPVIYKGATSGRAATCVWNPDDEEEEEVDGDLEVRSWDGQVVREEVTFYSVGPVIITEIRINGFDVPAELRVGEAPEIEIDVTGAREIVVEQDGEVVFIQAVTNVGSFTAMLVGRAPEKKMTESVFRVTVTGFDGQQVSQEESRVSGFCD